MLHSIHFYSLIVYIAGLLFGVHRMKRWRSQRTRRTRSSFSSFARWRKKAKGTEYFLLFSKPNLLTSPLLNKLSIQNLLNPSDSDENDDDTEPEVDLTLPKTPVETLSPRQQEQQQQQQQPTASITLPQMEHLSIYRNVVNEPFRMPHATPFGPPPASMEEFEMQMRRWAYFYRLSLGLESESKIYNFLKSSNLDLPPCSGSQTRFQQALERKLAPKTRTYKLFLHWIGFKLLSCSNSELLVYFWHN